MAESGHLPEHWEGDALIGYKPSLRPALSAVAGGLAALVAVIALVLTAF